MSDCTSFAFAGEDHQVFKLMYVPELVNLVCAIGGILSWGYVL